MAIEAKRIKIEGFDIEVGHEPDMTGDDTGLNLSGSDLPPIIEPDFAGISNVIIDFSPMLDRINSNE